MQGVVQCALATLFDVLECLGRVWVAAIQECG
jgi:hypothetical protein